MADLRIVDAPLLSTVKGTEKIPTGGEGNFSVSVNQVADFAKLKWFLATEEYVDNVAGNVQADLNLHKNSVSNPHQVTKAQVGLSNVDNTADLDKPVSNATQSAIITANSGKADKSYVDSQDQLKADKNTVEASLLLKADKVDLTASKISSDSGQTQQSINDFGGAKWYTKSGGYELGATVKLANGDIVKSTVANNIINPNVDMTGWVKVNAASQIFDRSGNSQQEINNGVETVADLTTIDNPYQGARIYVKGFHKPTNFALAQPYKGGGEFVFNSLKSTDNDGVTIFNGWERQNITELTPEMAGAVGDGVADDADALILCITKSYELGLKKAVLGAYTYQSSKELPIWCGNSYYRKGVGVVGQGKDATYIKFTGVNGFRFQRGGGVTTGQIANGFISDMTIENLGGRNSGHIGITGGDNMTGFSSSRMNFINWSYATKFDGTFYICSFLDLFASTCLNGFHTGTTGTTLYIDRCYVQGGGDTTANPAPSAFKLNASYSHVGALACDNYAGTAYNFDFGGGFAASLGIERSTTNTNPNATMFAFTTTNWTIGYAYMLNTKGLVSTNRIFSNTNSTVNILTSRIHENDSATTSCLATYSRVYSDGSASQFARTTFNAERLDVSFADYNPDKSAVNWRVGSNLDGVKYIHANKRPFIGLYDKQDVIDKKFGASLNMSKTSLWFDVYGDSFRYAGYDGSQDYRYNVAPLLGDWGIQRRPDLHGIAAVVNLKEGATEINSILTSETSIIPLINRKLPSAPTVGAFHINTTSKVMNTWDGSAWMEVASPTLRYSGSYNPPSIGANSMLKYELALTGVTPSHFVQVSFSIDNGNVIVSARAGVDKVYVYFNNISAAPIDLPSGTLKLLAKL